VFRRFGEARDRAQRIEFLSDNGPEYTSHRLQSSVRAMGLIPCHTPRRSPGSNGLVEAFFGSFKRDYVYQACLETLEDVKRQSAGADRALQPAATAQRARDAVAGWLLRGMDVQNETQPVQN